VGRRSSSLLAVALALAWGCSDALPPAAPEGRRPVTSNPVGPVPGVGEPAPERNPLEGDPSALQNGRRLFVQMNCAGCHGGHAGGGMGPSLRDPDWLYGKGPGDVFGSIAEGRGKGMPAWGTRLTEREIWELALYVSSLATPREPEAP